MAGVVCIIGARKGSERLPGKNKLSFRGKPLFINALEAAESAGVFDLIIFTTDDEDILSALEKRKGLILDKRPANLADNESNMFDVIRYVLEKYKRDIGLRSALGIVTPCQPFRTGSHIRQAYETFNDLDALTLVSVTPYPAPVEMALRIKERMLVTEWSGLVRKDEYQKKYYVNGAVTFLDKEYFLKTGSFYSPKTAVLALDWPCCMDIDYPEDYNLAKKMEMINFNKQDAIKEGVNCEL